MSNRERSARHSSMNGAAAMVRKVSSAAESSRSRGARVGERQALAVIVLNAPGHGEGPVGATARVDEAAFEQDQPNTRGCNVTGGESSVSVRAGSSSRNRPKLSAMRPSARGQLCRHGAPWHFHLPNLLRTSQCLPRLPVFAEDGRRSRPCKSFSFQGLLRQAAGRWSAVFENHSDLF